MNRIQQTISNQQLYTYADYLTWPETPRYELIDGKAYAMAPAPSVRHQDIVLQVARQIANQLDNTSCRPFVAPLDVRLPKHPNDRDEHTDRVVQPDIFVVCDPNKIDERGVLGAPDWIIEILSPGSASYDQITKRALYERVGVREYWVIHPIDGMVFIYRHNGTHYEVDVQALHGQSCASIVSVCIEWDRFIPAILPDLPPAPDENDLI
jgi:Uma2 family endonuclease